MLMEIEPMRGINDARHPCAPCSHPANECRDCIVDMDDVELFTAEQRHQFSDAACMFEDVEASFDQDCFNTKTFPANLVGKIPLRAYPDDLMARFAHAAHQGQQEMVERKIEVAELTNFHGFKVPGL